VPGLTGMWQISGRNNTTYELRTQLDDYYVRNWSTSLDLYIVLRTLRTIIFTEGAY
jgi:lipopolysaccharide/colanic/teichoic acid biosynthesis glycosyltransferase